MSPYSIRALFGAALVAVASFVVALLAHAAIVYGQVSGSVTYWHVWEIVAALMLGVYAVGAGIVLARWSHDHVA